MAASEGVGPLQDKDAWNTAAAGTGGYGSDFGDFAKYPLHCGRVGLDAAKVLPGEKLLEVACGPGDLAIYAAKQKGATVDCIDFSEGMIQAVREKLVKEPAAVTPHVMDGQNLQFEDGNFDVVCSSFGVNLFPDWRKGLKEMVRVAKPGGRILLVVPDADSEGRPGRPFWYQVLDEHFQEVLPLPVPEGIVELGRKDLITEALRKEGLENIEAIHVPFIFRVKDPESVAKQLMSINLLLQEAQRRLSKERGEELVAMLQKDLAVSKLEDGSCGKVIESLAAVAYKPLHS